MVACLSTDVGEMSHPPKSCHPSAMRLSRASPFAFGSNESADPVVASSRAMRLRVCPPMLFTPLKAAARQNFAIRLQLRSE